MHKHIISLTLLTVSFYVVGAAQESQQIPSLRDLALQRVVQTMTSQEGAQRFARDPEQCEEYVESWGINSGAIKELIADQLLKPYKHDNEMYTYKKLETGSTVWAVAWHQTEDVVASVSGGELRIWDVFKRELERVKGNNCLWAVAWHPSENVVASGSTQICIWDRNTGNIVKRLRRGRLIYSVAWHPEGNILASGEFDRGVCIWDVRTEEIVKQLRHRNEDSTVFSVAWHPKGNLLASGSMDGTVCIWDWQTGHMLNRLEGHRGWVKSVSWHPNRELLASGSTDCTVRIWDWQTGRELKQLHQGQQGWVYSVAWHPDGELLASGLGDKTVRIWDWQTGRELKQLIGHQDDIKSVSWNSNGELLASGSFDKTIRLWDLKAYDRLIEAVSLMQILYFMHRMEHAGIMNSVADKGKEEEKQSMDADQDVMSRSVRWFFGLDRIEQNLRELKGIKKLPEIYMHDVEASLPDALKRILHKDNQNQ